MTDPQPIKTIVTARDEFDRASPVCARTPGGLPDVVLKPLGILARLLIRGLKTYLSTLIPLLMVGGSPVGPMDPTDFYGRLVNAATLALAPAVFNVLLNFSILIAKLDESRPELMG